MSTITKTKVGEIQVGAVLDFDAHTGCTLGYHDLTTNADGTPAPYAVWGAPENRPVGTATVTAISAVHDYYNTRGAKRHVLLVLDNGHTLSLHSSSKLPVQA